MKKAKVIQTRLAGPDHAVVSVINDKHGYRREVCEECPWRKDSPIGAFPPEAYRHSARTAYDAAMTTFACHMSGSDHPKTCAGFLLAQTVHNLQCRINTATGRLDCGSVRQTVPIYRTYREMAVANGVDPKDPVLEPCRDDAQLFDDSGGEPGGSEKL